MATLKPTPELLSAIIERIPEGFIHQSTLRKRIRTTGKKNTPAFEQAAKQGLLAHTDVYFYDSRRLTEGQVTEMKHWCSPEFPAMTPDGIMKDRAICDRIDERNSQLSESDAQHHVRLVRAMDATPGYIARDELLTEDEDFDALRDLLAVGVLGEVDGLIYDPLRLGPRTMKEVSRRHQFNRVSTKITDFLAKQIGQTAPQVDLHNRFGTDVINQMVGQGEFVSFKVKNKRLTQKDVTWIHHKSVDHKSALSAATEQMSIPDDAWADALSATGGALRSGASENETLRSKVVARSFTINRASKVLGVRKSTLLQAIENDVLTAFTDPEDRERIPAFEVANAADDAELLEAITAFETVQVRDLSLVVGINYAAMRRQLGRAGIDKNRPTWGQVRSLWDIGASLAEFKELVKEKVDERREAREAEERERKRRIQEEIEEERRSREQLRERLVNAFPTWRHNERNDQQIWLHIGPPNSGKTHDSLTALTQAGTGWYLAPLRLLAFEIFDRLNQKGVRCNLLTGEEHVPVEGATITAATIEMFNPENSGECIIIDEAQMLADSDRGWAWTRAMMQSQSPDIHIIAPATAQQLIENLAASASIDCRVIKHERLAPIEVAERNTPLEMLQPRTILVAFSRRMVLHLKTTLEQMNRSVSVVYGSLPPEVRRRQADRFAEGETEICIATDAVGMGLNLPADYVIFNEIEKYDGTSVRLLKPSEVQQIGGRAGRYGISTAGQVGSVNRRDLKVLRELFYADPRILTHARVAPSVEDLALIPGALSERLEQWAVLESIPDSLRDSIQTTNLDERVELAKMLTDEQVAKLGLGAANTLINAPTRQSSRSYWLSCATALIEGRYMPLPPAAPKQIRNSRDLETTESCISCADIYLWLAHRREFKGHASDMDIVKADRMEWSMQIDDALLRRIDTSRRCEQCGRKLPRDARSRICDRCYYRRR